QMNWIFAGQQSFSQQDLRALQRAAFREARLMRDQNVSNVVGIIQQINGLPCEPEITDVPILACGLGQKTQRIFPESQEMADQDGVLGAARPFLCVHDTTSVAAMVTTRGRS